MKKITQLISILDPKLVDKLVYLDRLLKLYVQFLRLWKDVEVTSDGATITIKFSITDKYGYYSFTERTFSIESLDSKIASYKKKFKNEFEQRASNPRIQREMNIRKWKKYIDDAESEMR